MILIRPIIIPFQNHLANDARTVLIGKLTIFWFLLQVQVRLGTRVNVVPLLPSDPTKHSYPRQRLSSIFVNLEDELMRSHLVTRKYITETVIITLKHKAN